MIRKPVIFLAFANVRDHTVNYLRNLPEEQRRIRVALERAKGAGLCEVVERNNATTSEILDVFQHPDCRNRIAILHYGGHANGYQLCMASNSAANTILVNCSSCLTSIICRSRQCRMCLMNWILMR